MIKLTTPAACAVAPAGVVINITVVPVICILALHKGGRADRRERGCCLWMWEVQVVHTDLCSNCVGGDMCCNELQTGSQNPVVLLDNEQ